jgi:K+-transporting ATPase KdpF subunit
MREGVKGELMVIVTVVVVVFLFGYLLTALLRPEWF